MREFRFSSPHSGTGIRGPTLLMSAAMASALMLINAEQADAQSACDPDPMAPGTWTQSWDWSCQMPDSMAHNPEFSHAALIPKGPYRGKVLLWRAEHDAPDVGTTEVFIFDPASPELLSIVSQDLESNLFCAGQSWDGSGDLVVTGGASPSAPPDQTYRFYPNLLGTRSGGVPDCTPWSISGTPWSTEPVGNMKIGRFYPILITLMLGNIHKFPSGTIAGGSLIVIGGAPPDDDPNIYFGTDWWETLPPLVGDWNHLLVSDSPYPPFVGPPPPHETYARPGPSFAEPVIDYYPRAFHLATTDESIPENVKNLLLANDVEPGATSGSANATNSPGISWVMKPRYDLNLQLVWELHQGPTDVGGPLGEEAERYYGGAVLKHELISYPATGRNRVILFGGSFRDSTGFDGIREDVREFVLTPPNGDPADDGAWVDMGDLITPRYFHNTTILPTGEILLTGGACEVDAEGRPTRPVEFPELYDPGPPGMGLSSGQKLAPRHPATGGSTDPFPRLYHCLAVLLPDGRVFSVGGIYFDPDGPMGPITYPDGRWSGEVFSPPYMTVQPRPKILSASSETVFFEGSITVTTDHHANHPIVGFALLRPAAVTHHFDNDQRYIELEFGPPTVYSAQKLEVFEVTAPSDDLGPPGYYMLFAIRDVNGQRTPSSAHFIQLR